RSVRVAWTSLSRPRAPTRSNSTPRICLAPSSTRRTSSGRGSGLCLMARWADLAVTGYRPISTVTASPHRSLPSLATYFGWNQYTAPALRRRRGLPPAAGLASPQPPRLVRVVAQFPRDARPVARQRLRLAGGGRPDLARLAGPDLGRHLPQPPERVGDLD